MNSSHRVNKVLAGPPSRGQIAWLEGKGVIAPPSNITASCLIRLLKLGSSARLESLVKLQNQLLGQRANFTNGDQALSGVIAQVSILSPLGSSDSSCEWCAYIQLEGGTIMRQPLDRLQGLNTESPPG
jgi:hypothetical protein